MRLANVDFPDPDLPTNAMVSCLFTIKLMFFNIFLSSVYPNETSLNSTTPSIALVESPAFISSSKSN